jgi:hypothetical protein
MATTKWSYVGVMQLPAAVPSGVIDKWEADLKAQRALILSRETAKIPNQSAFQDRIADASSDQYDAFLATVGGAWDIDVIKLKQRAKLGRQYATWLANITDAFTAGHAFDINVTAKKNKLQLARYTLGAVGLKYDTEVGIGVWNPATMGALLMRGDTRCARYFDANDTFTGSLESVVDAMKGRYGSPALIADTVRCSVLAKFCDEAGNTTLRDSLITATNTRIVDIVTMMLNSTHKGTGYSVTWVLSWDAGSGMPKLTLTDSHP